jgi:hypothetical protein
VVASSGDGGGKEEAMINDLLHILSLMFTSEMHPLFFVMPGFAN